MPLLILILSTLYSGSAFAYQLGKVSSDLASVHETPSPSSPTKAKLPKGTQVNASDESKSGYFLVRSSNTFGWVRESELDFAKSTGFESWVKDMVLKIGEPYDTAAKCQTPFQVDRIFQTVLSRTLSCKNGPVTMSFQAWGNIHVSEAMVMTATDSPNCSEPSLSRVLKKPWVDMFVINDFKSMGGTADSLFPGAPKEIDVNVTCIPKGQLSAEQKQTMLIATIGPSGFRTNQFELKIPGALSGYVDTCIENTPTYGREKCAQLAVTMFNNLMLKKVYTPLTEHLDAFPPISKKLFLQDFYKQATNQKVLLKFSQDHYDEMIRSKH